MVENNGPANLNSRKSKLQLLIVFLITGFEDWATFPLRTFNNSTSVNEGISNIQ